MIETVLLWITVAWLAFVALHRLLSGRFWLWHLPDLIPPVAYLAGPLVLLGAALATRAPWWCLGIGAAALVLGIGHSGLNWRAPARPGAGPDGAVRVVVWNTEYWHGGTATEEFYDYLRFLRADIYVLQEYILGAHGRQREVGEVSRLRSAFPGYHVVARGELLTLSRFPVECTPKVGPAKELAAAAPWRSVFDETKVLRTDLRLGSGVLSVYNVHIPAQYTRNDNPLRREFYPRLRERHAQRKVQFVGLLDDLAANRNAVLVGGDFNSTGAMGEMRGLFQRLTSANRAARRIYPVSWSTRGPRLWQLDWTFTAKLRVYQYRLVDPEGFSDHRVQDLLISIPEG